MSNDGLLKVEAIGVVVGDIRYNVDSSDVAHANFSLQVSERGGTTRVKCMSQRGAATYVNNHVRPGNKIRVEGRPILAQDGKMYIEVNRVLIL